MIQFLGVLIAFLAKLFDEFFSWRARAREKQEKFEVTRAVFESLVNQTLTKIRWEARRESGEARDLEDQLDRELRERKD